MDTSKNARRTLLPLLAALTLVVTTSDGRSSAQTPAPAASWSLVDALVKNTIGAIRHDLEEIAGEFPRLSEFGKEAKVGEDSLSYAGGGVGVSVEFRHPLTRAEADGLDGSWRVYRLKDGKLLGARSRVGASDDAGGRLLERRLFGVVRSAEAQLLDHAGADTRGSTRDLAAAPFEGWPEEGKLYRAEITYDRGRWEWVTVVPPRLPHHHSGRIEWLNAGRFPGLYFDRPPGARFEVVFEVVRKKILRRSAQSWSTTYECLILGVEGGEPRRAEFVTLVAACRGVRPTGKRNAGVYFTLDVRRVVSGRFGAREFTAELDGAAAGALLGALGVADPWGGRVACGPGREVEMTFELSDANRPLGHPGLLREFRVIE